MASTGYDAIIDHVAGGDPEATAAACQQALAGGASAQDIVTRGLSKGMRKIARDLNRKGMYLDTMLGASFAFNAGLEAVRPRLERERGAPEGTVVLAVVDGPWTIGTGIASAVLQANNLRVIDAGSHVTPERVVAAAVEAKADVVAVGMYLSYKLDLLGAANPGITLVREIVLSDVIDEDELKTGLRREGVYFGVTTFVERFALVLIGGSTALVLGLGRYQAGVYPQAPQAVLALRWGMFGLSILALAVFLLAMHFYPLGKAQVEEMRLRLEQLHQQKAAQLTGD